MGTLFLVVDCPGGYLTVPFLLCPSFVQSCLPCALSDHTDQGCRLWVPAPLWLQESCIKDRAFTLAPAALLLWSAEAGGSGAMSQHSCLKALLYLPSWALQDVDQCLGTAHSSCREFSTGAPHGIARHAVWALCLQLPSQVLHCPSCPSCCPWKRVQFGNKPVFQSRWSSFRPRLFPAFSFSFIVPRQSHQTFV